MHHSVTRVSLLLSALLIASTPAALAQSVRVATSMVKIRPTDSPGTATSAEIHAAQNEFEAFQVIVTGPATSVSATPPTLVGPGGAAIPAGEVRLYREAYLNISTPSNIEGATGRWPDALVPDVDEVANEKRNAFPFDVPSGENRVIWVDVHVPVTQTPGTYTGTLAVNGSFGTVNVPVTLVVWNFALRSTSSLASTFGMNWGAACFAHFGSYDACGGDAGVERMHQMYARFMLDHRVTADVVYTGPASCSGSTCDWSHFDSVYGALFDGTDAALRLQGAQQTSIRFTWGGGGTLDHYTAWAQHFRAKGWFDRTYDYTCDEPPATCAWSDIPTRASLVHQADPQFRTLVTTNIADANANGVTSSINIMAPVVNHVDDKPDGTFPGNQRPNYDPFLASNSRNLLWWYQSCMSHGCNTVGGTYFTGWPSFMVDVNPVQNRAQGMLSWLYNVSGVLYFETLYNLTNAWSSVYAFGGNGDGTLLYPGKPSVIGGTTDIPVASIRLKLIREGFEDYEYMKLVSDLGDPAYAQQTGQSLFPNVFSSDQPGASLLAARENLAQRILQLNGTANGPSVTMTSPTSGATVSGTITLSASASDPAGIAGVQFLVDNSAVGTEDTVAPFSMSFDTTTLANGSHTFAARARNTANATATSSVAATVSNGTSAGQISLVTALALSPASPVVGQSTTVTFTVENTGGSAISVQYFLAGARDPSNGNVDFPASAAVTLQPGQQYSYSASRSFSAAGSYTTWPAYYNGVDWIDLAPTAHTSFTVQAPSPGNVTLVSAMTLSPSSPFVNQTTTSTFTVQNTGGSAVTVQYFLTGARNPSNGNVDFPASAAVTLQPGQQYTYSGSRSFPSTGTYTAWPAYFDGTNWIQLAAPSSFTVQAATPGNITLMTPLALTPSGPAVGQSTTATFTVQNTGGSAISVQYFLAGARNPSNANVDFPASTAMTLQPGQQFTYSAAHSFSTTGTYLAWPAYYDGTNWIQLASSTSFTVH